ncbi:fibrillin-1-like [Galleria mellonella]|uniref:Fibrillin-1-like n=1 Tax=Galleria mellonella TaxID=7137 RepID=A0ABM3MNM1_GALME|nr:fibrillin-1-like [Galleria mellonella]
MLCYTVVGFIFALMHRDAHASFAEEMAKTTELCCNQGTRYARNHTSEECSSSVPPSVNKELGSLCIFAMDSCCKEYFQKMQDCDTGIDMATSTNRCDTVADSGKRCCEECLRGTSTGVSRGDDECMVDTMANSAEELLPADAFTKCCQKAAKERKKEIESHASEESTLSRKPIQTIASICEEYAPNELCAHHCIPVPGSYKCECNPGFKLMADGRNCIEVQKNRCKPRNPCQHKCNDNGIEVKCSCRRGYELMPDGKSCRDIDECVLNPPVCLPGTECHNVQGSYKCIPSKRNNMEKGQCPPGFSRNIINNVCDDINECILLHPPCPSYLCENTIGAYKCGGVTGDPNNLASTVRPPAEDRCPPGFKAGFNEECEDVDECIMRKDDCNPISQFCINTRGSFHCQDKGSKHCPPGFKINTRSSKCEDIDECEESTEICRPDQICVNQLGQYDCKPKIDPSRLQNSCPDGMRHKPGSTYCEDIDECLEGTHLCDQHQNCLNTNGSHECHCKLGFELDIITGACVDVNECATDQHDCLSDSQRCDNTVGSFICVRYLSCGTGYILQHATGVCEDIDECSLGTHNCARAGPQYSCVNIPGSFRCVRKRTTTTSTTLSPEYEYYYDESEEIVDEDNETKPHSSDTNTETKVENKSEAPVTTTTEASTSQSPPPKPIENTPPPEQPKPVSEKPDDSTNEIIPPQIQPTYPPSPTVSEPPPSSESQPKAFEPSSTETISYYEPKPQIPEQTSWEEPKPVQSSQEPAPTEPPIPVQPYQPQQPESSINESVQPETTQQPETTRQPETTYSPSTESSSMPSPKIVNVVVGKDTATVNGERTDDGAVIVDTNNVPKNKWTVINEKPASCQAGFEMDEYGACFDIDECATNRHSCSGLTESCRNTMGGYLCDCAAGFRRDLTTGACDIIPTTTSTVPPTTVSSTTEPVRHYFWGYPDYRPPSVRPFRPRNLCDAGYHHDVKTGRCEDIDECTNGQANCASVEVCVNTDGGYRCECPPNWKLDDVRHRCVQIRNPDQFPPGYGNEPEYAPPEPEESISHGSRGYKYVEPEITKVEDRGTVIKCPWGYKLGIDNTCEDINECVTGEAKCGPLQLCTNLPGGYTCSCPLGHKLVGDHECEDVDECQLAGSMPICSKNADCVNTIGSYRCDCHKGFKPAPVNEKICVDVDECMESRSGTLCQQRCNNVWGGYRCSCHRGYRLNTDNRTCSDVDECAESKTNKRVLCVGRCHNEPGSYRCSCPLGYRLSEDKKSCIDIDECETGEAPCAKTGIFGGTSHVCQNTRGGYRCHRIVCPPGYYLESKNRCSRTEKICPPNDWKCMHQPLTYSYNYITFVSNLYIPASKVDLFTMRGPTKLPDAKIRFQLRLVEVNAPPTVKEKADINAFLLVQQSYYQVAVSLVRPLIGPQSIELELSMELYSREQFEGIAVAKLFIHVSEYEF